MKKILFLLTTIISIINCNENPADFASLSAPVAYALAKNAIRQEKPNGQITILATWESLKFENNEWPHGSIRFLVTTPEYPNEQVNIHYIFNGTYTATSIVKWPRKEPIQYQINLYESALILGQATTVESYLQELAKKISVDLGDRKVAVFEFQGVLGERGIFGKRISESIISHLVAAKAKVVERKLLEPVFDEIKFQNIGLVKEDGDQVRTKIGKFLGANTIITGTIKNEREELIINARAIDLEDGVIISASQTIIPKYLVQEKDLAVIQK
ncbi:FlgO family outer membrane protein [Leptospira mtsangambouensis]|uniref:FlgO family outer membrane protein n=1 Tax=Leptospira mtsangambouensis TaxID=2484912 RepID=UPI001EECC209|nr:FlgO family outer membrane protein [Leptospira mtsangambouensis]MCG6142732.1 curli production assembly/transport component CsgG domain protein [Leptospira mtsangambouensis]